MVGALKSGHFSWGPPAVILGSVGLAAWAWTRRPWAPSRIRRVLLGLAAALGTFWFAGTCLWFALLNHTTNGSPYCWRSPHALETETCEGRDFSFMQGRRRYSQSFGKPRPESCEPFLREKPPKEENCEHKKTDCAPLGIGADWRCFVCERFASTGDWYRMLHAFRPDCLRLETRYGVNIPLADIPPRPDPK